MRIDDGSGFGYQAKVNEDNRLSVEASTRSAQSRVSIEEGKAFQVNSGDVNVGTSEQEILVLKNNSASSKVVITYMRLHTVGVADKNVDAYWRVLLGGDYASGGDIVESMNVNTASGAEALDIDVYSGTTAIVTSGTPVEIDKDWTANDRVVFNKEGALIISPGGMLVFSHKGSTAAGIAWARVSYYLTENGGT